jgi:hypothetical protein
MTSCCGNVKFAKVSFHVPFWAAAQWLLTGFVPVACLTSYESQPGVASMTPLWASMNRTFQPKNGSSREVPARP